MKISSHLTEDVVDDAFSDMARQPMLPWAAAFDCGAILPEHRRRPSRSTEEVDSMVVSLLLAKFTAPNILLGVHT
jgi:hypothetical protein